MGLVDYVAKRPTDRVVQTFDFTAFAAEVSPQVVEYVCHGDPGPEYTELSNSGGLITLQIDGGNLGGTYLFGYSATTANGLSMVDMRRLRIRDTANIDTVALTLNNALLLPNGIDNLATENGDVLAFQ